MRTVGIITLILTFLLPPIFGQRPHQFSRTATASVYEDVSKDGSWVRKTVNRSFDFQYVYFDDKKGFEDVLLSQRFEGIQREGQEGNEGLVEVTAWRSGKEKYDTRIWTISDPSDDGHPWGNFYETTKGGCCGDEDLHKFFNLRTGKHIATFTTDPALVEIPNTPIRRILAYASAHAAIDVDSLSKVKGAIGTLTFGSNDGPFDKVFFFSNQLAWSPHILLITDKDPKGVTHLQLWSSKGINSSAAVKGFKVKLVFEDNLEAIIPIENDRFALQKAVVPDAIRLERRVSVSKND
jgi:hypothetical protein